MIVVTGAAGFIGSNIVAHLNERGRSDIVICDRLRSDGKWRNLRHAAFVDFVPPDDFGAWLDCTRTVDAVIHMGAISTTLAVDGDEVIENNFRLSLQLLDYCTRERVPFLYASSAAVYGGGEHGFVDDMSPEAVMRVQPLNLYGWSKRQFDFVVADRLAKGQPLPPSCIGLRFFNVFGPNEYHKGDMMSLVAKIAKPVSRGERIKLFKSHRDGVADGDQRRDFIYVKDAVEMSLALLERPNVQGIFNIGTGHARSFRELAEAVFAAFGREPAIDYAAMPEAIRGKYQYFTKASLDHLRQAGGYRDVPSLEESIADYVGGYLSKDDPYR